MDKISFGSSFNVTVGRKGSHVKARKEIVDTIASAFDSPVITEIPKRTTKIDTQMDRAMHIQELKKLSDILWEMATEGKYSLEMVMDKVNSCLLAAYSGKYHDKINLHFFYPKK